MTNRADKLIHNSFLHGLEGSLFLLVDGRHVCVGEEGGFFVGFVRFLSFVVFFCVSFLHFLNGCLLHKSNVSC